MPRRELSREQTFEEQDNKQQSSNSIIKMQRIISNDNKFTESVTKNLKLAFKQMDKQQYQNGLEYLVEAQKILEYGASCGKIIDRRLIVNVLHNQACCYQKIHQKVRAAKYIEAIIYNLKAQMKSFQYCMTESTQTQQVNWTKQSAKFGIHFSRKLELAQYYLQFCSLCSQTRQRTEALEGGKRAVKLFQQFFQEINQKNHLEIYYKNINDKIKINTCLSIMKKFKKDLLSIEMNEYQEVSKKLFQNWEDIIQKQQKSIQKTQVSKFLANYSIGNLVDITKLSYQDETKKANILNQCEILSYLAHFAMGYFQVSTQYRLIAQQKYIRNQSQKQRSQEYLLSKAYHLLAINFIALYIPYDFLFMRQIVTSFQHHYKISLRAPINGKLQDICQKILFEQEQMIEKKEIKRRKTSKTKKIFLRQSSKSSRTNSNSNSKSKSSCKKMKENKKSNKLKLSQEYFMQSNLNQNIKKRKRMSSNDSKNSKSSSKNDHYLINTKKQRNSSGASQNLRSKRILTSNGNDRVIVDQDIFMNEYGTGSQLLKQKKSRKKSSSRNSRTNSKNKLFKKKSTKNLGDNYYLTDKSNQMHHTNKSKGQQLRNIKVDKIKQKSARKQKLSQNKKSKLAHHSSKKKCINIANYYL